MQVNPCVMYGGTLILPNTEEHIPWASTKAKSSVAEELKIDGYTGYGVLMFFLAMHMHMYLDAIVRISPSNITCFSLLPVLPCIFPP